jgi:hypothetical protein
MYRKQILYVALISMKYLFNLEHEIGEQLLIVFILSFVCMKQVIIETAHNTALHIEEVTTFIKYLFSCMKEQMHQKNTYGLQVLHLNS